MGYKRGLHKRLTTVDSIIIAADNDQSKGNCKRLESIVTYTPYEEYEWKMKL